MHHLTCILCLVFFLRTRLPSFLLLIYDIQCVRRLIDFWVFAQACAGDIRLIWWISNSAAHRRSLAVTCSNDKTSVLCRLDTLTQLFHSSRSAEIIFSLVHKERGVPLIKESFIKGALVWRRSIFVTGGGRARARKVPHCKGSLTVTVQ